MEPVILALEGEFDHLTLPTISEKVDALLDKGHTNLIFNLHRLKFVDSSALGYLLKTWKQLKKFDGELVLSQPSEFFSSTVAILGFDEIFKIFPSDDDALRHFSRGDDDGHSTKGAPLP